MRQMWKYLTVGTAERGWTRWKMTVEKLAWIGLGIMTSYQIALHAVEIIIGWIQSEKQSQIIATDGERKEDVEKTN